MPAEKPGRTPHPFDVAMVEKLIGLMARHDLSEVDLHDGDSRIRLRKGNVGPVIAPVVAAPVAAPPAAQATAPAAPVPSTDSRKYQIITSPTPGTFYAKPSPDEAPYVKVGSKVSADTVVCKIEAMKIFNDIVAECAGTIAEILVENAQPVEYGQALFKVAVG